jgi:hypothetical protein
MKQYPLSHLLNEQIIDNHLIFVRFDKKYY